MLDLIWKFLKAGVMEDGLFARTETGVPQGGVISPLLANVYLNEFDKWAEEKWHLTPYEQQKRRKAGLGNYRLIRYADDFVVLSNDRHRRRETGQARRSETSWRTNYTWNCPKKRRISPMSTTVLTSWDFTSSDANQKDAGWYIFDPQTRPKNESKGKSKTSLPDHGPGWMNITG